MLRRVKAGVLRIQAAARRRAATLERWSRFVRTRGGRMRTIELGMRALLTLTLSLALTLTLPLTLTRHARATAHGCRRPARRARARGASL
jgi:hypothetical protein